MDALRELIGKEIDERIKESDCIASTPCVVLDDYQNGYYLVEDIKSGSKYTVPNFSGSAIGIGENIQLFFKNGVISNKSAYIGAANYKSSDSVSPVIIEGLNKLGELVDADVEISLFKFKVLESTNLLINFNANIFGTVAGELVLKIIIGETELLYKPRKTISLNEYNSISFSLPFTLKSGEYTAQVIADGVGNFVDICTYIYGFHVKALPIYDPTSDADYIYELQNEKSNSIFFTGDSLRPSVPNVMGGKNTNIIRATTFNTSDVLGVYIPEGITEIE